MYCRVEDDLKYIADIVWCKIHPHRGDLLSKMYVF